MIKKVVGCLFWLVIVNGPIRADTLCRWEIISIYRNPQYPTVLCGAASDGTISIGCPTPANTYAYPGSAASSSLVTFFPGTQWVLKAAIWNIQWNPNADASGNGVCLYAFRYYPNENPPPINKKIETWPGCFIRTNYNSPTNESIDVFEDSGAYLGLKSIINILENHPEMFTGTSHYYQVGNLLSHNGRRSPQLYGSTLYLKWCQ